jgi:hypothetical protein
MFYQKSIPRASFFRVILVPFFLGALIVAAGCDASKNRPDAIATSASANPNTLAATASKPSGKRFDLTIAGFNYTNRYIDDYRVNGQWGGNLNISGPGSAGGGSVCCVAYFDTGGKNTVKVRWQSGACYFTTKSTISTDIYQNLHSFYKEIEVQLDTSRARNPNYLEVHFYPDGTVKAVVTDATSGPAMIVDPASEDRSEFPRCPDDKKPL